MVINISYKMMDNRKEEYIILDGVIPPPQNSKNYSKKEGVEKNIKFLS